MAKRKMKAGGTPGTTGDITTAAVTAASRLKEKTNKLPKQIAQRHQDKSLYVLLLILSLFCVNLYFFVKNVMGKSLHEKDALKNMGQDERKKADEEDDALKSAVEFYNNITTAIHSAFLVGNIIAINEGTKIHTTYYISLGLVITNLALSLITTYTLHISFTTKTQGFIYLTALINICMFVYREMLAPSAQVAKP